jgi:HEPN domain-containing protein
LNSENQFFGQEIYPTMQDQAVKNQHFNEAEQHLAQARAAINKPERDLVPYTVCENAYLAVKKYLINFLHQHGRLTLTDLSLEQLLSECRVQDAKFNDLHINPMYRKTETEDVWMNPDAAQDNLAMAEASRKTVLSF